MACIFEAGENNWNLEHVHTNCLNHHYEQVFNGMAVELKQ